MRKILLLILVTIFQCFAMAVRKEPYTRSRINWDMQSRKQLFDDGWYARMIQLQDGRLLAASESGWNVIASYSEDGGETWSPQEILFRPPEGLHYFDVDLIQLSDGKIIITYNIGFPDEKAPEGRFGVRLRISEDNGTTWSDDIFVYDGERTFENGTWEPNILELPSGELHLYVSDEAPYTQSAEQCIQLFRSIDKGYSWHGPETVSFRKGARDGMPTALILGDSIVVTIEDNGWPDMESFIPVTVRTPLTGNWKNGPVGGDSPERSIIIDPSYCPQMFGGAPYMRLLPSGETILSRQSYFKSGEYVLMNMFVYVGDENGKGFKAMSQPFSDNLESRISIEVNSLTVASDSTVFALGGFMSGGTENHRHVEIVKGYPLRCIKAPRGKYYKKDANQIKLGCNNIFRNVYADFKYDNKNLYFRAEIADDSPDSEDGVRLLIDVDDVSDDTPVSGMYEFFFPTDGNPVCRKGENGNWINFPGKNLRYRSIKDDRQYVIEAALPWKLLGKKNPPKNRRMAIAIEVDDMRDKKLITESIPDARHDESWTWPEFLLIE